MVKKIKKLVKKIKLKRTTVLVLVLIVMFLILIQRLFSLQIIHGEEYAENFELSITKKRILKGTRGNILDRNGVPLAYNQLSYSIILEDNGTYDSTREKNLTLNAVAYELLNILKKNKETTDITFHIVLDEDGSYAFDAKGFTLDRFKADIYGEAFIDKLDEEKLHASAEEDMKYLCGKDRFALVNEKKPYTKKELKDHGLPESFTPEEMLEIVKIRYILSTNGFKKYVPVTIATNVSEVTVAEVMERKDELQGVDIAEDSIRVYKNAESMAPIIGYTGKADAQELEELREERDDYASDAIIGKSGVEQTMETKLQGKNGSETVFVDTMGKILDINEASRKEPSSGNDVYLTIDSNLQRICYDILEQKIAGILSATIINTKEFKPEGLETGNVDTASIRTPIYDVYYALIENNVLDINHFNAEGATALEKKIYELFQQKQSEVFEQIKNELTKENPDAYKDLPKEMQEYQSYLVNNFLISKTGILSSDQIDSTDPTYVAWTKEESISLKDFLIYAAGKNWIDISRFSAKGDYLDTEEVYVALADYLTEALAKDKGFSKLLYKYMLHSDVISGAQLCMLLYDQGVLEPDESTYRELEAGSKRAYDFMIQKISNLEITPAQLALDPCSGSVVITDVNTGETLACVTYPGYDNNRLANNMDTDYFTKLNQDLSRPFYNKATQQLTAPGSTFKVVTAVAGMEEGIVTDGYSVLCTGKFDKIPQGPNCWLRSGHGSMNVVSGIANSCNVFMGQIAYDLGMNDEEEFSNNLSLQKLEKYASMFGLTEKSGLELYEEAPKFSDTDAIRSSFGQGTHNMTTSQLARYVTSIASRGTNYELSLFDKVTDSNGEIIEDYTPTVNGDMDVSDHTWNLVHEGMLGVAKNDIHLSNLGVTSAGKTGTAQEDMSRPSHALFIGFAPFDKPEIGMAVRIGNGYSSSNAVDVAKDILRYKYKLADESEIVTGTATMTDLSSTRTD